MNMASDAMYEPLTEHTLTKLQDCCQDELARYRRQPTRHESVCCLEIVRRAAATPDDATFAALLAISRPTIQKHCPADLRPLQDDLMQEVAARLFRKFSRAERSFQVTTFAAYLLYVQLTCKSATQTVRAHYTQHTSLDHVRETTGFEPAASLPTDTVEHRMLLDRWLHLLPDLLMREAFRRRFALGETPAEIAEAMKLSKREVYRLVEQAIRRLSSEPEVRAMLET